MSTVIQFTPSTTAPFQFSPVIAGTQYNAVVTWNVWEERYYLNLYNTSGTLVLAVPVVATGPKLSATMTWTSAGFGGVATALTAAPHNVPVGQLANVYISQTGTAYDGAWQALATGANTMTWSLANPNQSQPLAGQLSFPLNIVAALGAGWMIFNYADMTFEFETQAAA